MILLYILAPCDTESQVCLVICAHFFHRYQYSFRKCHNVQTDPYIRSAHYHISIYSHVTCSQFLLLPSKPKWNHFVQVWHIFGSMQIYEKKTMHSKNDALIVLGQLLSTLLLLLSSFVGKQILNVVDFHEILSNSIFTYT